MGLPAVIKVRGVRGSAPLSGEPPASHDHCNHWLPDGQNSFKIRLAVWTQYRRVRDRQTRDDSKDRAKHSVARVKTRSSADADNALDAFSGQSRPCGISDGTLAHVRHMTNVVTLKLGSEVTQGH